MANPEHLDILKQGVEQWNKWRKADPKVQANLSGKNLSGKNLSGMDLSGGHRAFGTSHFLLERSGLHVLRQERITRTNFRAVRFIGSDLSYANLNGANLVGADLSGADLTGAGLNGAVLSNANLVGASLFGANLSRADLRDANLVGASLLGANLIRANLRDADLSEAFLGRTLLAAVDLSVTKNLETIEHRGPSTIGFDTMYKSHGKIPEVFLRGCGMPDDLIAYIKSIAGTIQFYSCFISYSTKDQEFADRLYADLQNKGVRCWFAPHDIKGGRKIHEQLDEAIRLHDKLLLILSDASMNSDWVGTEIGNAREREAREKKQMLFPITLVPYEDVKKWKLFDADRGKDSAKEIREYFIPDFSNWKDHDSYQIAFQGLVSDLKAEANK